jgi:hypothetical protein
LNVMQLFDILRGKIAVSCSINVYPGEKVTLAID